MTTGRQSARPRLRDYRERRGLTQQQVADELMRLAWLRDGKRVGVNADMVSKWERGDKRPSPMYRDLFCMLFRATAAELVEELTALHVVWNAAYRDPQALRRSRGTAEHCMKWRCLLRPFEY